ncbi:MAG: gamma-glutamyltransferase [Pseudomonadota bacterium]
MDRIESDREPVGTRSGWQVHKPEVVSEYGLVAAQNWLAAEAGAGVLANGGNAIDAAVTTVLTLSVVEPWLSGIGGGGFLLRADGATGHVDALDFSLVAPAGLDVDRYKLVGGRDGDWFDWPAVEDDRNLIGPESICVPGTIAGMAAALDRFGTISFAEALAPAIAHAKAGLSVDWFAALALSIDHPGLSRYPETANLFLANGEVPKVIDAARGGPSRLVMNRKQVFLETLATQGPSAFYQGDLAKALIADLNAAGSAMSEEDLAGYEARWTDVDYLTYGSCDIHVAAGLNGGTSLLRALTHLQQLMSGIDRSTGPGPDAAHAYARAIRGAYEHRLTKMGHAANPGVAGPDCTTHVSVVDRDGTMVSVTNTLLSRFGSKFVAPSGGFLFNNGMMWFDPRPGQPNSIAPGKRPLTNMSPVIGVRDGKPALAIGAAGGRQIFPSLVQLLSYHLDFEMDLEAAFHEPRLDASQPTIVIDAGADPRIAGRIARDFPTSVVENTLYPVMFAVPSAVARDTRTGVNSGMAHPLSPWASVKIGAPVSADQGDG